MEIVILWLWPSFLSSSFSFSVQLLSRVQLFVTPLTAACQASLSITNTWSLLKLKSIELVMPSNHLILCHPLLLPSVFPSIRVFSNESVLHIRWPKYWSFRFDTRINYFLLLWISKIFLMNGCLDPGTFETQDIVCLEVWNIRKCLLYITFAQFLFYFVLPYMCQICKYIIYIHFKNIYFI